MRSETATLSTVLTYKKVWSGTQPTSVVDAVRAGQTFSAPFELSPDGQSLTLTTTAEPNFTSLTPVELVEVPVKNKQLYLSAAPFKATVFGQEYPIARVAVLREAGATAGWVSAIKFEAGCLVGTGPLIEAVMEHLRDD